MMRDLDRYQQEYLDNPFEEELLVYRHQIAVGMLEKLNARNIIEVGCGLRPLFDYFDQFDRLTIVEPSPAFAQYAKDRAPRNTVVFNEHLSIDTDYSKEPPDAILLSSLLHEVEHPETLLETVARLASNETVIHVSVPNAHSFHRQLALKMGIINSLTEKSERQTRFQQHSTFTVESLTSLVESTGYKVLEIGTFFIKPFTHEQMQRILDQKIIDSRVLMGLNAMSDALPTMGAEIYTNLKLS